MEKEENVEESNHDGHQMIMLCFIVVFSRLNLNHLNLSLGDLQIIISVEVLFLLERT